MRIARTIGRVAIVGLLFRPMPDGPDARSNRGRKLLLALAVILAWASFSRFRALRGPFGFGWQHLAATYSTIARNYHEYGPIATRFAMVENAEPAPPQEWVIYTHHPPGLALTTAALSCLLGDGPLPIRLLGTLSSLLQIVVTYALVAEALSFRAGIAAAFATAVLPAGAYFANHGSELGPEAMAFVLLALLADERARARDPERPRSAATLGALALSLFFAWPALIVAAFVSLRDLLGRRFRRALLFAAVVPAALGLHLLHMRFATADRAGHSSHEAFTLIDALLSHSTIGASLLFDRLTVAQIAHRLVSHLRFDFGIPALALAVAGAIVVALEWRAARKGRAEQDNPRRIGRRGFTTAAGLVCVAALYTLPLFRAVVVHRYWFLVALPMVAFLCGAAVHATPATKGWRIAWIVAGVIVGVASTQVVLEAQRIDRTPLFEEAGTRLRDEVPGGAKIDTTIVDTACLAYYARHRIVGGVGDANLEAFMSKGSAAPLPMAGWVAVVDPSVDPNDVPHARLLDFLKHHWEPKVLRLERTGADLLLFDLSRPNPR